jgi:hypothetical protein
MPESWSERRGKRERWRLEGGRGREERGKGRREERERQRERERRERDCSLFSIPPFSWIGKQQQMKPFLSNSEILVSQ